MKNKKSYTTLLLLLPLLLLALFFYGNTSWDKRTNDEIDEAEVAARISELTGPSYEGRQTGSLGGSKAAEYIKEELLKQGIKSPAVDGYGTSIDAETAIIEAADFMLEDKKSGYSHQLEIFKDYKPMTEGLAGSIDYRGEILILDEPIEKIPAQKLFGRILAIKANELTYFEQNYVLRSGGKGILYYDDEKTGGLEIEQKSIDPSGKRAKSIFIAQISGDVYEALLGASHNGIFDLAKINVKIKFPYSRGENILGYIPAKNSNEYLVFIAGYDGYGSYGDHAYVPGAIDNASGVSGLLELSAKLAARKETPVKNIVFMFLDGEKSGAAGIKDYIANPLFPIEETEFVLLQGLGWKNSNLTRLEYSPGSNASEKLAKRIVRNNVTPTSFFYVDLFAAEDGDLGGSFKALKEAGLPVVRLSSASREDLNGIIATPKDDLSQWNERIFAENLSLCLSFVEDDCYNKVYWGDMDFKAVLLGLTIMGLLYLSYLFHTINRRHPGASLGSKRMERIYYSRPRMLIEGLADFSVLVLSVISLTAFAANIHSMDLTSIQGLFGGIFSFIKNINLYAFNSLYNEGLFLSLKIVSVAVLLVFFTAVPAGIWRGKTRKKGLEGRGILQLAILSIPQAFIALGLFYISLGWIEPYAVNEVSFAIGKGALIFPVLSMSIIPFVCLSEKVSDLTEREMTREYVFMARVRGLTDAELVKHVSKGVVISAVKLIPKLTAIVLSNLIVVEYIFGLPGIMNRLLLDIKSPETVFFAMIIIGAVYTEFLLISKVIEALLDIKGGN